MRTVTTLLISVLLSMTCMGQSRVEPTPNKITVFLNGAELTHDLNIKLIKGKNNITLGNLSDKLLAKSVQATFADGLEILSVNIISERPGKKELSLQLNDLNSEIERLESSLEENTNEIQSYHMQLDFLKENYNLTASRSMTMQELDAASEFFRKKTMAIQKEINTLEKAEKTNRSRLEALKHRKSQTIGRELPYRKAVNLLVEAPSAGSYKVKLRYLVSHAGWAPTYDIVAKNVDQPITLRYKAQVYNNTGIDWHEIPLVLSTGDPKLSATMPSLDKWDMKYSSSNDDQGNYQARYGTPSISEDESMEYKTISVPSLATEFEIDDYDIPSNGRPYTVKIKTAQLDAIYYYGTVPKLDPDAFLVAKVTGWTTLDLIDGPASVYFSGTYIGESEINTRVENDTLKLSLGRDSEVKVSRKLITETDEKASIIGNARKETYTYKIEVKNDRDIPVMIDIYDQIPIPVYDEINVNAIEISDAEEDEETGLLKWNYNLKPGESKEIILSYSVRYPKSRKIHASSFRTISCPSF